MIGAKAYHCGGGSLTGCGRKREEEIVRDFQKKILSISRKHVLTDIIT